MMDTEVVLKNLGQNIRELRKSKKMTIDQLAEKSSLSGKYLQGVEVGNRNISIKNLNKICKALETSPDILLNMKPYNLKNSEEKIFAISEKLKKFEENKLDFIGNMLDHLNNIMREQSQNNNNSKDDKQ
ncbi:helix-turn-helix transcriptional regulator [Brachyspira pulli]|uniref:helix-turn-helix domain-containing protein n=1 Tax=Brachyspira pulli TaxID=310721 RepID=UPI0030043019